MMLYQCTTYCFVTSRFSVTLWTLHWCSAALKLGWARGKLVALDAPLRARLGDTKSLDQDIFQLATFQSSQTRYILFTFSKAFLPIQRARLGDTNLLAQDICQLAMATLQLNIFHLHFQKLHQLAGLGFIYLDTFYPHFQKLSSPCRELDWGMPTQWPKLHAGWG